LKKKLKRNYKHTEMKRSYSGRMSASTEIKRTNSQKKLLHRMPSPLKQTFASTAMNKVTWQETVRIHGLRVRALVTTVVNPVTLLGIVSLQTTRKHNITTPNKRRMRDWRMRLVFHTIDMLKELPLIENYKMNDDN
jgi:hypothetical protein